MIGQKKTPTLAEVARAEPKRRRDDAEHRIQVELVARIRSAITAYPALIDLHAIPNGGKRGIATAKKMKAEGVLSGVPDLFLPVPAADPSIPGVRFHGMYLETKAPGGSLSKEQRAFMQRAVMNGYACAVYREAGEGLGLLLDYLMGRHLQGPWALK